MTEIAVQGIMIPFIGTTIGAMLVFFLKKEISKCVEKMLLGFASGVMIAASIWSLLMPAIEMSKEQGSISWFPASVGMLLGIIILMITDDQVKKIEKINTKKENKTKSSTMMMILAVTLHNIPEGMAVGVIFAGLLMGKVGITISGAMTLALGIAIQNIQEGAIISMPLKSEGMSKIKSFFYGILSGIVEPIGAVITIILTGIIVPILAYLLAFAAGAMIYVVAAELIPQMQEGKFAKLGILSLGMGFIIMMILDVALA